MGLKVTAKYRELLKFAQDKKLLAERVYITPDPTGCCGMAILTGAYIPHHNLKEAQAAFVLGFEIKSTSENCVKRNILYFAPPTVLPYTSIIKFLVSLGFKKIGGHTINPKYGTRELGIYLLKQE